MMNEQDIRRMREDMRWNLDAWSEPMYDPEKKQVTRAGSLYCTEPDPIQRALTRIELRNAVNLLTRVLDEVPDDDAYRKAQHRDAQRIADDAVQNARFRDET